MLHPKMVDEQSRPPSGWASGLLVWGAVPKTVSEDDLPAQVARWSHFGRSDSVQQLIKWLEWRLHHIQGDPPSNEAIAGDTRQQTIPGDDNESELSSIPDDNLLSLLNPEGYKPSPEMIREEGTVLLTKLKEVVEWLEVLEWKGLAELPS